MKSLSLALLLTLPFTATAQDLEQRIKEFRNNKRFSVRYDKFTDESRVDLATFRHAIEVSDNAGLLHRAGEAALAAFREIGEHLGASERGRLLSGRGVGQDKRAMEHEVIRLALEQARGRVSEAARIAGMSWQGLAYALRTRHKDLLKYRTPVLRRTPKRK